MKNYTELTKTEDDNLIITLTDEGREALDDLMELCKHDTTLVMLELLEDHLCNGWTSLRPEQIGALTACDLILSDRVTCDDEGNVTHVGRVFWHPNYEVEDALETLRNTGSFTLTGN
jgi:hypothetical protein